MAKERPALPPTAFGLKSQNYQPQKLSLHPRKHVRKNGDEESAMQVCDLAVKIPATPDDLSTTPFYGALLEVLNSVQEHLPGVPAPDGVKARPIKGVDIEAETRAHGLFWMLEDDAKGEQLVPRHGIVLHKADVISVEPPRFLLSVVFKGLPAEIGGYDVMCVPPVIGFYELGLEDIKLVERPGEKGKGRKKKDKTAEIDFDKAEEGDDGAD